MEVSEKYKHVRGLRNNNPGNIRKSKDPWQGLLAEQPDDEFFVFSAPRWGIRAMARLLITYQDEYKHRSINDIINRWAPPSENDTAAYIRRVSADSGIGVHDYIDMHDHGTMKAIITAMIRVETGVQPYDSDTVDAGLRLAGVEPPAKPLIKSTTVIGGATAATAAAVELASAVIETGGAPFSEAAAQLHPYLGLGGEWLKFLFLGLIIAGALTAVLARVRAQRKGKVG